MEIPHWLSTPAFVAAIVAVFSSLLPILLKVLKAWTSRRASTSLIITLGDGNKVSIEGKSLDEENIRQIIKALEVVKAPNKGGINE